MRSCQMTDLSAQTFFCHHIFLPHPTPVTTSIPVRLFRQDGFGRGAYEVVGQALRIHESRGKAIHESLHRTALYRILGERSVKETSKLLTHQD